MATSSGPSDLIRHLQQVQDDPQHQLDIRLFERVDVNLTSGTAPQYLQRLLPRLIGLLPQLQQDPDPVADLATKLLRYVSLDRCLTLIWPEALNEALSSPFSSINRLALTTIDKAAASPDDVSKISQMPGLVEQLLKLWLMTPETEVASRADATILGLLVTDCPEAHTVGSLSNGVGPGGKGAVWKRLFTEESVYEIVLHACSWGEYGDKTMGRKGKTQAQARLLSWLPKILLQDWSAVATSRCPKVDDRYMTGAHRKEGLLGFAANEMVDAEDDVLMHMALIDFYTQLLGSCTQGFEYLVQSGIHVRIISSFLKPISSDQGVSLERLLRAQEVLYLAAFATAYPSTFLSHSVNSSRPSLLVDQVAAVIGRHLRDSSKSEDHPAYLTLLQAIPRIALLHPSRAVYLSLTLERADPSTLNTLAALFHGPTASPLSPLDPQDPIPATEPMVARVLYSRYLSKHPSLPQTLIRLAQTVALHPTALAAIRLLTALATATWQPCPSPGNLPPNFHAKGANFAIEASPRSSTHGVGGVSGPKAEYILPSEPSLGENAPRTGVAALLGFPAGRTVIPYALKASQRFTGLVGGLGGAEDAAYQVAAAKFEFVRVLAGKIEEVRFEGEGSGIAGVQGLRVLLRKRVGEGVWGGEGEEMGAAVATMDA